jgi:hypothetical protein
MIASFIMIVSINITSVYSCPDTKVYLMTDEPWSKTDEFNLNKADKRCEELYKKSPCLKKFIRWEPLRYSAICGKKEAM